ncbi:hypothetical protein H0X32_03655 [Patescibacteria group bacterium]|nr:hypothetical protein [Patescibacteria group bacterium]
MSNSFENPGTSRDKEYKPDETLLEMVMAEARKIAPDASEVDIRGGSIRAMRAAEVAGKPFTEESFSDTEAVDGKLKKGLEAEIQMHSGDPSILVVGQDGSVIRNVKSDAEAQQVIRDEREAA